MDFFTDNNSNNFLQENLYDFLEINDEDDNEDNNNSFSVTTSNSNQYCWKREKMSQRKDLIKLLNHENNDIIKFSQEERCFKRKDNHYVKGLLPLLNKIFWPTYEYIPSSYKHKKNTGLHSKREGLFRGGLVHHQLELYVNKGGFNAIHIVYDKIHSFTKKALAALNQWKLIPIISEIPIYNEILDVATKADLICLDNKDDIVLIEWKCGMDNYISKGNDVMNGPLKGIYSNCPLNQAYVQLLFTKLMIEKMYQINIKKAYVIQIHNDGIDPFPIPKRLLKQENKTFLYFENEVQGQRQQQRLKKRKIK